MEYVIVAEYQSDAERKRIDYAIERERKNGTLEKPKGVVILYQGNSIDTFLDDLYARLGSGKDAVRVYAAENYSPSVIEQTEVLEYVTEMNILVVDGFLNYIVNKLGASFEGIRNGIKCYVVYTKKGQVGIDFITGRANGKTTIKIVLRGFGEVVSFMKERVDTELKIFIST